MRNLPAIIKVIVVDDNPSVRSGLAKLICSRGNVEVVATAESGEEFLSLIPTVDADLLLLDLSMPGLAGVPLIKRIKVISPGLKIIVLTMDSDPIMQEEAMDCGVSGYILKGTRLELIHRCILDVIEGGVFVDPYFFGCA